MVRTSRLGLLLFPLLLTRLWAAPAEFRPLWNGKDLSEFIVDTPGIWSVADGVIAGKHNGLRWNDFLRTRKNYTNFVLRAKFRLKANAGNSGIQFRSSPVSGSHEVAGYQADIGQQYWGSLYDESRRKLTLMQAAPGSLEGLAKDGWNEYVITAAGSRIRLELNGKTTVDYVEREPGIAPGGFLALQVHAGTPMEVEFKDMEIRDVHKEELPFADRMGPAVSERVPAFSAPDQNGKMQTLASLAGPKGLLLLFVRSADW